ncbi:MULTISPECIES: hypothetical protein [Aeromonas]|nr:MULTISPECIES: hypothetical protein [Aeromonas]MBL0638304.1 hypothetical protein [Aeromonas veronii]MCZ0752516.1 hypothetical protein [Aeromonas enteropelogenes]
MFFSASKVASVSQGNSEAVDLAKILQEYQSGAAKRWEGGDVTTVVIVDNKPERNRVIKPKVIDKPSAYQTPPADILW